MEFQQVYEEMGHPVQRTLVTVTLVRIGKSVYRAGLSIGRKVLKVMFWEVPPAGGPLL